LLSGKRYFCEQVAHKQSHWFPSHRFSKYLMQIGDGVLGDKDVRENLGRDWVELPSEICLEDSGLGVEPLIHAIYPDLQSNLNNREWLMERSILCTKNAEVDKVNLQVTELIRGEGVNLLSFDRVGEDEHPHLYAQEFLNELCPSSLPPHRLWLKLVRIKTKLCV